ncbi:MAG TPA: multiheme c-type cytochrome [Pyrinomonadaceae bacterium]|nr:multiheme c-type cytochrome [Pyrinomonadaceae bacterium]
MSRGFIKRVLATALIASCAFIYLAGERSRKGRALAQTGDDLSRWRAHDYAGVGYVGDAACAKCHEGEAAKQHSTPMARALSTVEDCELLSTHTRLEFRNGPFTYRITRQGVQSLYSVTDGVNTINEPLQFCFGQGEVGQTYVFRHGGKFYETRVSFFRALQKLDFTVGHAHSVPSSVEDALGRPIGDEETQSCFGCHAPAAVRGSRLQLDPLRAGVGCEGCHGPGERHVAAARAKDLRDPQIFNPATLNGLELSQEFCGKCHMGFEQAMLLPEQGGANNIRFQAYRIFNSPGHNGADTRISCVACHDPHDKLERSEAFYDTKCLACHLSDKAEAKTDARKAPACPVARDRCAKCHMPKIEIPGMHYEFTDHWIRIVKPGEPVPH